MDIKHKYTRKCMTVFKLLHTRYDEERQEEEEEED